jgi:hypothetical protein
MWGHGREWSICEETTYNLILKMFNETWKTASGVETSNFYVQDKF